VNEKTSYGNHYLELVSYENKDEFIKYGLFFTELISDVKIEMIKKAVDEISIDKKNGIYLSYVSENTKTDYKWVSIVLAFLVLLIAFIIVLIIRIRQTRKENDVYKMLDPETGMGNLQFFKYYFNHTINDISRTLYHIAYIILDSSYLSSYHADSFFDDVLKYTVSVLSEYAKDNEISARITDNGFIFAFQAINDKDARKRIEEVMRKLNNFEDMTEINNKYVFYSAVYHMTNSDKNCEILLFNLRKNCNKIFGTEKQIIYCDLHSMNMIQEEKKITKSILKGFEKNEFKMYLQFIVDNETKNIVSAEALSRWDNHEKGLIGPVKYIKNMESAGLISRHDFYMFELVCRQLEKWQDTKYNNIIISCNFTRITLSEENFIDKLKMISQSYNFEKSKLAIEITEDAIEKDREKATKNIMSCKELGFNVYLDDLGSGYTALINLCDYPIDVVKIDRGILLKTVNNKGKDLFLGIIDLVHKLNIKVICEGVETEEQNKFVSESGCDYVQGWYFSKALPLEECESFIENYTLKRL